MEFVLIKYTYLLFHLFCNGLVISGFKKNLTPEESLKEDMFLDTVELMTKYGYKGEKHKVTTEDGYILELHRMLPDITKSSKKHYPAFLMHGLTCSSFDWLTLGPGKSLSYLLHDEGYDVWLGNARGTMYSTEHTRLDPKNDKEYWKFSWHQIGYYDLPASIDYVLAKTNASQLHYTGHSQGTTSFFVMCSMRPEYNDKIRSFNALAPPVFMSNMRFLPKLVIVFFEQLLNIVQDHGLYEIPARQRMSTLPYYYVCRNTILCESLMFIIAGTNKDLLNRTLLPLMVSHIPAGFSILQPLHYGQEFKSGRFCQFDYGKAANKVKYGSSEPPDYPLQNVRAPVALHYSNNDLLVDAEDVKILRGKLSNVVLFRKVPFDGFNHVDYIFAMNLKKLLYDSVIEVMMKFE